MKRINMMNTKTQSIRQKGFNLMEVLIGIAIFAIGMLALASLQGSLSRTASDANTRMVATNLAEALIERRRGFARLSDPTNTLPAYDQIADETYNVTVGQKKDDSGNAIAGTGVVYTVDADVTDFYYDPVNDVFTAPTTPPTGVVYSDFKRMVVNVSWATPDFRDNEGGTIAQGTLGTGEITLVETISSVTTAASSRVVTQNNDDYDPYVITYTPGLRPDIVSLSLGNSKFKESLTPQPDVIRRDDLVETKFDVITYSQTDSGSFFVRREEFASVSCDCQLKSPSGAADTSGRRPAVWAGDEYTSFHWVDKPYGESDNNSNSQLCDVCCRDHHDGGSATDDASDTAHNLISPWRDPLDYFDSGTFDGDHKHYNRLNNGTLVLADSNNASYKEACRMVRIDGFFKVVQDFRQEDRYVFPEDFLDDSGEVDTYSDYVTVAADNFENAAFTNYEQAASPICIGGPSPCVHEPTYGEPYDAADPPVLANGEFPIWTTLPLDGEPEQQLRSRGIYIDYLTYDLRTVIDCLRAGGTADSCQSGDVILDRNTSTNVLEIIPFFDVQMTYLNRWTESPIDTPVDTTNEGLEDDNTHSRGVASTDADGASDAISSGHRNNLSFTDTQPIDLNYTSDLRSAAIEVQAGTGGTPVPNTDPVVEGNITETVNGLRATDIEVEGINGALCDRTPGGFSCSVPPGATNPRVRFFAYGASGKDRWACMPDNPLALNNQVTNGANAEAVYELHDATGNPTGAGYNVNVQDSACLVPVT